ncbi:hypothetical protein [Streptomyces sp. CNQ-509]|uniref:hypothetical protein n=2 Tax=unclassified Streptomyces TaxID=2593676 RepID=UPI0013DDEF67|nr:hypothetical protein [Streptomyces sp. CNQ-509]
MTAQRSTVWACSTGASASETISPGRMKLSSVATPAAAWTARSFYSKDRTMRARAARL